jgi:hypothetical protein
MLVVQILGLGLVALGVLLLVKKLVGLESDLQIPGVTIKAPASVLILVLGVLVFLFPYSPWWPGNPGGTAGASTQPPVLDSAAPVSTRAAATPVGNNLIGNYRGWRPADAKAALVGLCDPRPCVFVTYAAVPGDGVAFRQVVNTAPSDGQAAQPGSTVVVYVSTGGQQPNGSWYEVAEGDLFSIVANRHGFTPWELLKPFNPGIDYDHMETGDLIWLPATH